MVVCTLDRPRHVQRTVADVLRQADEEQVDVQVVVVDQSAVTSPHPAGVEVITAAPGLPAARNTAARACGAPVLLFLDDDVLVHPGCLRGHLSAYADPTVGGVVGRIIEHRVQPNSPSVANRMSLGGRIVTNLDGLEAGPIATLKGANMSVRAAALAEAGGFDPGWHGTAFLEDADVSMRIRGAGWALRFEPRACVEHLSAPSGGVRQPDPLATEGWRFHNTGRFVRRHHGWRRPLVELTFLAIAVKRAASWRRPGAVGALMAALHRGFRDG